MAKHKITFQESTRDVLHSNMTFVIHRDEERLGELSISKGTIDWKPRNGRRVVKWKLGQVRRDDGDEELIQAERVDLDLLLDSSDIECECMVCHLPLSEVHGPVEWKLTVHFPGPCPEPGDETMLLCTPCYEEWRDHAEELYGIAGGSHKV